MFNDEKGYVRAQALAPAVDCRAAAVNNELLRLITACYKEDYFQAGDEVCFSVASDDGNSSPIDSLEQALEILYDARLKDAFHVSAWFKGVERRLRCTADAFGSLSVRPARVPTWGDVTLVFLLMVTPIKQGKPRTQNTTGCQNYAGLA